MSKHETQLRHFLKTLTQDINFPKQAILNFLAVTPFNSSEFSKIYGETWQDYLSNIQQYREVLMLLCIGLTKNVNGMIENALDFIEGMILSRLIMLIFNQKLEFQGDRVLLYLEPTVELTVAKALENGKEQQLLEILERVNSKKHKFNEVGFLLEFILIKKVQKYLQEPSLFEFNELLKGFINPKKITRLNSVQNCLNFRHTALLRQEEDKQDTYYLQFISGNKLIRLKSIYSESCLPNWVQQAFWKVPRTLNFDGFRSTSVSTVYCFLSEVEVFASSPLIEEFDCYTREEIFLTIFQQFLMGLNISNEPYQFHWEKMRRSLDIILKNSEMQHPCYKLILAEEMCNVLGESRAEEFNLYKRHCD